MVNRAPTVERDDPLFVKDGVPVKFCFHKSVTQGRSRIARDVERHGGQMVPEEHSANVLLVDEQEDIAFFRRRYYSSTELYRLSLYVEPRGFVQACIRAGAYRHAEPIKQRMPGRAPVGGRGARRARVPFTEEDRDHLAYYIATRCPTRDGRMGNNAYKDLERLGQTEDQSWEWARRHTFHSWREHYKMNTVMMDARIDYYLKRLKPVGHHLGHDPRRHDQRKLRPEEEEEEEEEGEEEEDEQWRGIERQDSERREQVRPTIAAERRPRQEARDYLARHEQDLAVPEEEEEVAIQEQQRIKRHRVQPDAHHQRDSREIQAKRARVSKASSNRRQASGVEASRGEGSATREEDSDNEESQEIEGSDLFGDRAYEDESRFYIDDTEDLSFPVPFSPRTSPGPRQDGPPLSTQTTLIASPRSADKEPTTSTKVVETQLPTVEPTVPPSSQQTLVMTQERVTVQRARVRGASAQPGLSMPRETRARGGTAAVNAPYRNDRSRSRSIDPQPRHKPESQFLRQQGDPGSRGKRKVKEEAPVSVEEDAQVEEGQREEHAKEDVGAISVTGGLSVRETPEDEIAVEGLLEVGVEDEVDEEDEESDYTGDRNSDGDEDGDIMPQLSRFQEVEIDGEPSDSDDAETHAALVRGVVREGSAGGDAPEGGKSGSDLDQVQSEGDEGSEDDDADRIERMASETLPVAPAPTPLQPRVTHSVAATPAQTQTQTQISPRRTRSGRPLPTAFPSPGTKARAVVDRFREEKRKMPYAPPLGSRAAIAAKAVRGRRRV